MSIEDLNARISELEEELVKKDHEIMGYLFNIEELEVNIADLNILIPEEGSKKKRKKKQAADSKFSLMLQEKDKKIRELKNQMGLLRKEKGQIKIELEKVTYHKEVGKARQKLGLKNAPNNESSVIRVEDLRSKSPLNALVKDLQEKVNKQRSLIHKLRSDLAKSDQITEKLKIKNKEVEILTSEIIDLDQKLKDLIATASDRQDNSITSKLIEDLQNQLNKAKSQIINLKQNQTNLKELKGGQSSKIDLLKKELNELKNLLGNKDDEIRKLKNDVESLQKAEIIANFELKEAPPESIIKNLKEDLQNKLNKAKIQIKSLQEQLKKNEISTADKVGKSQKELEGNLKMLRMKATSLQIQLETKEGEIQTIKNEAVQIKKRYRQLENQLKQKDHKLNEVQVKYDKIAASNIQTPSHTKKEVDPHIALRIKELMSINDELKKDNVEQRIEITHLRSKS
ncbi:MAG TPA: hypothetical protein ENH75_09040 [archaeon]|nr:hypothetical protein [archaeon]